MPRARARAPMLTADLPSVGRSGWPPASRSGAGGTVVARAGAGTEPPYSLWQRHPQKLARACSGACACTAWGEACAAPPVRVIQPVVWACAHRRWGGPRCVAMWAAEM
eukprot:4491725-Prymnesium_polylepis.1